jgi:hydroxymethylbilane synthase
MTITVGARSSLLSRAQVDEVLLELRKYYPSLSLSPIWVKTTGDKDLLTSLKLMDKTDFFTKEIDQMLLKGECRIAVHSAKDLPDPLTSGLCCVALTVGVDSSDVLVLRDRENLSSLPANAKIATSSLRREEMIKELREDFICVDIRGTIEERLKKLDSREVDALVMAEAALIRLKLTSRNRIRLPGPTAKYQGQLAILAREDDTEMQELFACIDSRRNVAIEA